MDSKMEDKAIEKLVQDEDFQKALKKYQEMEEQSSEKANKISIELVKDLGLQDQSITIEQARNNLVLAKMTAVKVLATLSSFNYEEHDFMNSLDRARKCVQEELVPMLIGKEPCGECEECKNGRPNNCIRPKVRDEYCESRFLPLLADALIEYDAWSETLYNNIPQDKRDIDILKDINDEFQNQTNIKRRGRPPKKKDNEEV
jgi:hypothetical protein